MRAPSVLSSQPITIDVHRDVPAHKTAPWMLLLVAVGLGIAGDALLRGGPWHFGFTLWIAQLILAVVVIGGPGTFQRNALLLGTLAAAGGLAWRDSEMLYVVDMLSVLWMGAFTIWYGGGGDLAKLNAVEAIRAALLAVVNSLGGALAVIQRARVSASPRTMLPASPSVRVAQTMASDPSDAAALETMRTPIVNSLVIGTVIAIPPVALVTALLASSDRVFGAMVSDAFSFLSVNGLQHGLVALVLAWLSAGWLRASLGDAITLPQVTVRSPDLPFASVSVVLYALVALLALFIATQARVLFGGEAFLMATQNLTLANYAREGFFQMVVAAGVVLATLVGTEWLLVRDDARGRRLYTIAGITLVSLVSILLLSATTRMWLYMQEFGLSVDRAFACAVMVWVILALASYSFTTLRGHSQHFAPATFVVSIAWVVSLNLANPEALVVHTNVNRALAGKPFDANYHAYLSADALPALNTALARLSTADCRALRSALTKRWDDYYASRSSAGRNWRSMNFALWRAGSARDFTAISCGNESDRPPHFSPAPRTGEHLGARNHSVSTSSSIVISPRSFTVNAYAS